eukprot:TRINITY_DN6257_c0_g1_i1.p1 TRINITY_DN6257_c0_g1~~TRINITY_DN6257_c0_g1_i1.p1  ORF type:complete len:628 (-),score=108.41 TRINITY_DN6257_c0_g1_i1:93-1976(-)
MIGAGAGAPVRDTEHVLNPDTANKVHEYLRGREIPLVWDLDSTQSPQFLVATVGDKMIGHGSSAVVMKAQMTTLAYKMEDLVFRVLPLTPNTYRGDQRVQAVYRDLAYIGRLAMTKQYSHVVGSYGFMCLTTEFDLAELQPELIPVDQLVEFLRVIYSSKENPNWVLAAWPDVAHRERFLGSLLLCILKALDEINSPDIRDVFLRRLRVPDADLVRVVHEDVKLGNLFLESYRTIRLGDLNSLAPCLRSFAPHRVTKVFTTPAFAPPELIQEHPSLTSRCGHYMAAATVRYFVTGQIIQNPDVTPRTIASELGLPANSPVVQVLCGCLAANPDDAMLPEVCMNFLESEGKYDPFYAANQLSQLRGGVRALVSPLMVHAKAPHRRLDIDPFAGPVSLPSYTFNSAPEPQPQSTDADDVMDVDSYGGVRHKPTTTCVTCGELLEETNQSFTNLRRAFRECEVDTNEVYSKLQSFLATKVEDRMAFLQQHYPTAPNEPISNVLAQGHLILGAAKELFLPNQENEKEPHHETKGPPSLAEANRRLALLTGATTSRSGGRKVQLTVAEIIKLHETPSDEAAAQISVVLWKVAGKVGDLKMSYESDGKTLGLCFTTGIVYLGLKLLFVITQLK